ncbi:MAG: hypothetical protein LBF85_05680, partial [Tannerella sp.]|nr:hypothetical protein [Tannerella sp.]
MIASVSSKSILTEDDYYVWGASPVRSDDGKYHVFYSRWLKKYGFSAWVTHSEVAHAVADDLFGPYKFRDIALNARGADYWDGLCVHTPTVHRFNGKYYIYYMGNTGDGVNNPD